MYRRKYNNFLVETLLPNKEEGYISDMYGEMKRTIPLQYTNNLTTVSALYIYTGTLPHGYGTQASKVAETVIRSHGYKQQRDESGGINNPKNALGGK